MRILNKLALPFGHRMPVILQTEAAECGLASLAMVASFYGHTIDLSSMRRRFSASLKGMRLQDIIQVATAFKLLTRPLRVELDELPQVRCPSILHWEFKHFVVLERVTRKGAIIHDPARGRRHVTQKELNISFTGIALELWPAADFTTKVEQDRYKLSNLFKQVIGLKRSLAQVFVMALILEFFSVIGPLGMQVVIDQALVSADFDLVTIIAIGMSILLLLRVAIGVARSWYVMGVMTHLKVQWEAGLFAHILRLPLSYFEKRHVGDIVSRFGALATIQKTLTTDLVASILDGIMALGTLAVMFLYSVTLTMVPLAVAIIYALIRILFYGQYKDASEAGLVHWARKDSHFMESIRGSASIKSLCIEDRRHTAWLHTLVDATNAGLKTDKIDIWFTATNGLLFGASNILMLWIGAHNVINGEMTIGMLIAFFSYQDQFTSRISNLISMAFKIRMLNLQGERLADIALTPAEPHPKQDILPVNGSESLQANKVSFRYGDNEPAILNNVDIAFEPGSCVALVGPSGCGKTTLLKCLAGLIAPTEGQILFDCRDIRDIGISRYRSITGCVLQDDRLFAGTLADNIAGFDPAADQKWVEEVARLAAIDDEILRMPMAYESLVGDMGNTLSGGQKQRIFLARALYRRPKILFLDEATSHLDIKNENRINDAITELKMMRIIVAHRPATIASADKVVSLENFLL